MATIGMSEQNQMDEFRATHPEELVDGKIKVCVGGGAGKFFVFSSLLYIVYILTDIIIIVFYTYLKVLLVRI